jgi:hypothetical protein
MKSKASRSADALKLLALAALSAGVLTPVAAQAQGPGVFRAVTLDMSGIPPGAFETRRDLQACLSRALPQAFAGRVNPGARNAPVLVVRPSTVFLANAAATTIRDEFSSGSGTVSLDSLEGEAIVGGQRVPVIVSANPDFGAIGALGYASRVRTETLCQNFAYWVARKV